VGNQYLNTGIFRDIRGYSGIDLRRFQRGLAFLETGAAPPLMIRAYWTFGEFRSADHTAFLNAVIHVCTILIGFDRNAPLRKQVVEVGQAFSNRNDQIIFTDLAFE